MNGANADQLPDLDSLDIQALKALVLAKQSELDSRRTEIENLKLFILKLKRMQFGPRSEKFTRDLAQLELQLEDLEASQAAAEPEPAPQATTVPGGKRKPARRPLPASLPRETETIAPKQESCPACGGGLKLLVAEGESVPGPILEIGNTNSRYKFSIGARRFVNEWNAHGPAHHCAVGVGHIARKIEKLGKLLSMETGRVC